MYSNRPAFFEDIPQTQQVAQISYDLIPPINNNITVNMAGLLNNNSFLAASLTINQLYNNNYSAHDCVHTDKKQKR